MSDKAGHFSVEVEMRNFPHFCGRDKIVTDMSQFFWSKDHEHAELINIRDFRLMVNTIDVFLSFSFLCIANSTFLCFSASVLKVGLVNHA